MAELNQVSLNCYPTHEHTWNLAVVLDDAHAPAYMHKNSLAIGLPTGSAYAYAYYTVVTRSPSVSTTIIEAATALLFPTLTKMHMHGMGATLSVFCIMCWIMQLYRIYRNVPDPLFYFL